MRPYEKRNFYRLTIAYLLVIFSLTGYVRDDYHAWTSIYTEETGWLNEIIEFKSGCRTLVAPTFGASTNPKTLQKFMSDDSNYVLQKIY